MSEIRFDLLQPVNVGAQIQQGFATGMAMVKQVQTKNALRAFLANPDDPQSYNALAAFDPSAAAAIQQQQMLRRKELLDQQERSRAIALSGLAASDPRAAGEEALKAGDLGLAEKFWKLSKEEQDRSAAFWDKAGGVAVSLKRESDPQRRLAIWREARNILAAQGAPAELLDRFDPTDDAKIDAAIATAVKVGELAPKPFNVGPGEGRYEQDPITGEIKTVIAPNPGGQAFGAPAGGVIPPPPPGFKIIDDGGATPGASGNFPG